MRGKVTPEVLEKVVRLRVAGLTQTQVAELVGVSQQSVSAVERGHVPRRCDPNDPRQDRLRKALAEISS